ncbi:MAG: TrkH family potassium uptake protein [Thermoanaerobaculia bacterium]|nr:TrkH family potassium uptake protein [Thermoanaerobaculia bacterium]
MNFRAPLRFLGRLVLLIAAAQLAPTFCAWIYGETEAVEAFLVSAAVTALFGGLMTWIGRIQRDSYRREGILIVVGGWILASVFGALPFLLTGTLTHPVDALFESASGFTTTGASVMTDIEAAGRAILFWRSFTQWLGGMGIIVLFVALLPELGPGARFLYKLEVPGPTAEALQPRIHDTAATLWRIYFGMTVAQSILLMLAGMDLYDALTHTFSTLSTGGFSPRNASVAAFDSVAVELIIIVFMVLAGTNFSLYYGMRRRRGWNLFRDAEFRTYMMILAGTTLILFWDLLRESGGVYGGREGAALLDSLFQTVSILTTTGFATADFDAWPVLSRMLLVGLMFVGGCAGSTSGSMKIMRMVIGIRAALREVRLIFSPNAVLRILVGGSGVPDSVVHSVAGFFILYLSAWGLGSILLAFGAPDLVTAATAAAATLGNIGPGLAAVGPTANFELFAWWDKALMVLLMWMGRLEMYAIVAIFTRAFWKT